MHFWDCRYFFILRLIVITVLCLYGIHWTIVTLRPYAPYLHAAIRHQNAHQTVTTADDGH